jgi:hypothetical protein
MTSSIVPQQANKHTDSIEKLLIHCICTAYRCHQSTQLCRSGNNHHRQNVSLAASTARQQEFAHPFNPSELDISSTHSATPIKSASRLLSRTGSASRIQCPRLSRDFSGHILVLAEAREPGGQAECQRGSASFGGRVGGVGCQEDKL